MSAPDHPRKIDPDQILYVERQTLHLSDFPCPPGWILDIGGGGEGIIGLLKGDRVVSIDPLRRELEEVSNDALKVVMDARQLGFLDDSFATAAAFCCLMYIEAADHQVVFREIHRVLRPGGEFWLWDVAMPDPATVGRKWFMLPVNVVLPGGHEVRTGYGVPMKPQSIEYFRELAANAGLEVVSSHQEQDLLEMRFTKRS
jgi:SAM-dependent methyltransferase